MVYGALCFCGVITLSPNRLFDLLFLALVFLALVAVLVIRVFWLMGKHGIRLWNQKKLVHRSKKLDGVLDELRQRMGGVLVDLNEERTELEKFLEGLRNDTDDENVFATFFVTRLLLERFPGALKKREDELGQWLDSASAQLQAWRVEKGEEPIRKIEALVAQVRASLASLPRLSTHISEEARNKLLAEYRKTVFPHRAALLFAVRERQERLDALAGEGARVSDELRVLSHFTQRMLDSAMQDESKWPTAESFVRESLEHLDRCIAMCAASHRDFQIVAHEIADVTDRFHRLVVDFGGPSFPRSPHPDEAMKRLQMFEESLQRLQDLVMREDGGTADECRQSIARLDLDIVAWAAQERAEVCAHEKKVAEDFRSRGNDLGRDFCASVGALEHRLTVLKPQTLADSLTSGDTERVNAWAKEAEGMKAFRKRYFLTGAVDVSRMSDEGVASIARETAIYMKRLEELNETVRRMHVQYDNRRKATAPYAAAHSMKK